MKLYGATPSPFFRKCRVVLEEKGIPYQVENLAPVPKTAELLRMHPLGKIPILRDGDAVVPDSSVICLYLEKVHPQPAVYPADPSEYARALFLEEYSDTKLAEVFGGIFFERFVKPNILKQGPDEARVQDLLTRELPGVMDFLEAQLHADRETVLARFSIADAAIGGQFGSLAFAGVEIDAARWPRVARYSGSLAARPSFKTALAG